MKARALTLTVRWNILLCVISCLLTISPFGHAQSITELKGKADDGDVQAELALAKAYHLGEGIEKDETQAVRWWSKAAEQGVASAQYNLGMAFRAGEGVQKDNVQAYFWIAIAASSTQQGFVKDYRDKVGAVLTATQLVDVQERIRKWTEAHPSMQVSIATPVVSVQAPAQDHPQPRTQDQLKPIFLTTNCVLKFGSMILSGFKEALQNSNKYELVPDLSDKGKMDVVITVKMICVEDKGNVAVATIHGLAKCFGPKNCHISISDSTLNALLSEPGYETQSGVNLFKGLDEDIAQNRDKMILDH